MKTIITDDNFAYLWEKIAKESNIKHITLKLNKFADGSPNLFIENVKEFVEYKEVTYLWDFSRIEDLPINYFAIRWILDYYVDKLRVIMPYFPVWTMERIDTKWQVATAKYFADIMSSLPSWREWKTSIHIFDIHALVERFLFDSNKVNAELHTAMSLLTEETEWKVIVFPDEWAEKRFWKDFPNNDKIICSKVREWDKRVVTIKQWDPKWRDLIIIDDLIQSWWTISETSDLLKGAWAKSVTSFSTHWVFPNKSHISLANNVDKLIVTDSIPDNLNRANDVDNMEILSIERLVKKIMFRNCE